MILFSNMTLTFIPRSILVYNPGCQASQQEMSVLSRGKYALSLESTANKFYFTHNQGQCSKYLWLVGIGTNPSEWIPGCHCTEVGSESPLNRGFQGMILEERLQTPKHLGVFRVSRNMSELSTNDLLVYWPVQTHFSIMTTGVDTPVHADSRSPAPTYKKHLSY